MKSLVSTVTIKKYWSEFTFAQPSGMTGIFKNNNYFIFILSFFQGAQSSWCLFILPATWDNFSTMTSLPDWLIAIRWLQLCQRKQHNRELLAHVLSGWAEIPKGHRHMDKCLQRQQGWLSCWPALQTPHCLCMYIICPQRTLEFTVEYTPHPKLILKRAHHICTLSQSSKKYLANF